MNVYIVIQQNAFAKFARSVATIFFRPQYINITCIEGITCQCTATDYLYFVLVYYILHYITFSCDWNNKFQSSKLNQASTSAVCECENCGRLPRGIHDDVIKWKHFPRYWPFVRGIHRSPVNSPHKAQWRGALMLSLICARIKKPVTGSFNIFIDLRLNKRLSKHWWGWWCETPLRPLWRHCNDLLNMGRW